MHQVPKYAAFIIGAQKVFLNCCLVHEVIFKKRFKSKTKFLHFE